MVLKLADSTLSSACAPGNEPVGRTPEQLDALYRADIARFAKVIADAKIPETGLRRRDLPSFGRLSAARHEGRVHEAIFLVIAGSCDRVSAGAAHRPNVSQPARSASSCRFAGRRGGYPGPSRSAPSSPKRSASRCVIENRAGAGGNLASDVPRNRRPMATPSCRPPTALAISPRSTRRCRSTCTRISFGHAARGVAADPGRQSEIAANNPGRADRAREAKPGALNYGSTGIGNPLHLTMEMLKNAAGIDIQPCPTAATRRPSRR